MSTPSRLRKMEIKPTKTYATEENADKAVHLHGLGALNLRYFIMRTADGRFFPVFVGPEAVQAGVHFHFHVIG